jgi:DNA-binding beta-propeller fold protein YncE
MERRHLGGAFAAFGLAAILAAPALADLVVVAVDNHSVNVNGVMGPPKNPAPDLLAIVDVKSYPPKLVGTVEAPTSVVGAPTAVWIAPDESWAIITAATKLDPADPTKIVDDDTVSVVDLKASPPKVTQTIHAGRGANDVSVSPDGTLALVTNRAEGTLSVFTVSGKQLTAAGNKLDLGNPKSMPSSLKFLPDGKTALVALYGDDAVGVLHVNGGTVTLDKQRIVTGVNPYTMDITGDGKLAVVSNMGGGGNGEICTVSLIDLAPGIFRTVDTIAVPSSPEGVKLSPDGKFVAVASIDGTTKASESPLFHDHGRLWMLAIAGKRLKPVVEAKIGRWSQGVAFSKDGHTVLVESMIDHGLDVFRWNGATLTPGPTVDVKGGAAAIRTSWP